MNPQTEQAFWLVWSPTGATPPKFRHPTEKAATEEAERLAITHPGTLFVVLESIAARRVDNMHRTTYAGGSLTTPPF
ncbi:hypothetical protein [Paraburkholderia pallida]|uniref:Uncharacterized protein n=1 Tax=Paraburkholderia pallida TaxID=2547399 RepID=A0A4P7CTB9_9BURK|nr:hypothetical protein [Paraburkholderia pallida]QBQ99230.1 hypothetical protein E1956_18675 [Paraburkholderia pallida]